MRRIRIFWLNAVDMCLNPALLALDARDDLGGRLPGLSLSDVSLLEDEVPLQQVNLRETEVGVRQVIVLNTNNGLRVRDAGGRSRFDIVREALRTWWRTAAASRVGVDDLGRPSICDEYRPEGPHLGQHRLHQ